MLFLEDYFENDQNAWLVSPYSRPSISITSLDCSTGSSKIAAQEVQRNLFNTWLKHNQDRISIEDQTYWYVYIWIITTETEYADGPA